LVLKVKVLSNQPKIIATEKSLKKPNMVCKKRLYSNQLRKNMTDRQQLSNQVYENSSQRTGLVVRWGL
jgi:hypothetical protein